MRVTAKSDYAVRAMIELASASPGMPMKAEGIVERQKIPWRFLLNILADLRIGKLVESRRGADGGYWLARPAADIRVADVIRAVEGPLVDVRGIPPEGLVYPEPAAALRDVWLATRGAVRSILETTTLADIVAGNLPAQVTDALTLPGALEQR
ncbi:MAG: Rrf2 family transcriptional regulator [Streptosporangiales bacterium]|nr:Rrf2 family transcriptional regulator [Streptosporangiales bacterium]